MAQWKVGPAVVAPEEYDASILDDAGGVIADVRDPEAAERIVACVNACEGIDTELLVPKFVGDQIASKMDQIDTNAELVANLKLLLEQARPILDYRDDDDLHSAVESATECLTKLGVK